MYIKRRMDKDVVHIYNGILLSRKKYEIMPRAATWMNLEIIIVKISQTEKDKYLWYHLYVEYKIWYKRTYLQKRNRLIYIENKHDYQRGKGVFSSVAQSCPTLCNPMNSSMPGLPVHHQLPESTQTHVHWLGDTIQPSHPLSSPSPPALNLSQYQGLFKWVSSSHQVAKILEFLSASTSVLPMNTQDWSPLGWTGWISLQSKGLSRVFSNTTVQRHQFFSTQLSL